MSIGKFLITHLKNDEWRVQWHTSEGKGDVKVFDLENKMFLIVKESESRLEEFALILDQALDGTLDNQQLVALIPEHYLNKPVQTKSDKFELYLEAVLFAFNSLNKTKYTRFDTETIIEKVRRRHT